MMEKHLFALAVILRKFPKLYFLSRIKRQLKQFFTSTGMNFYQLLQGVAHIRRSWFEGGIQGNLGR
jgi:hypothetical protein